VLAPVKSGKPKKALKIPDFAGQMQSLFEERALSTKESAAIREGMRGER
jgi:hypothetical protein